MHRICILVAELRDNPLYPVKVSGGERFPNEAFELEGAALALVVELVVESFRDVGIHGAVRGGSLHGAENRE
jgi:hypothetical protein